MGNEKATRIQTSLLNGVEKKALVWLAKRQPVWATSNMLTAVGTLRGWFWTCQHQSQLDVALGVRIVSELVW